MSIDGTWNIVVNSPMGSQKSTVTLTSNVPAGTLSGSAGSMTRQGEVQELKNGKTDGANVSWEISITTPMPMTLSFVGKVEGNALAGHVRAGAFGSFPFSGTRA